MTGTRFAALWATAVLLAAAWAGEAKRPSPPPLVVGKDAPTLPGETTGEKPKGKVADNAACFVCHANYKEEPLAVEHARQNIGCAACHGRSDAHCNDENNTTPPDTLFPADRIDAACRTCHDRHDAPAIQVIARWRERCPTKTDPKTIVCTDCHGRHRLRLRTVRWDKRTRKLLPRARKAP
jgi:hypothetical protein